MSGIEALQLLVARCLVVLALIHVPVLCLISWMVGGEPARIGIMAVALAAIPVAVARLQRPVRTVGFALAITLVGQTIILVGLFEGHPWQLEMHFYFFAVLAMLAGFCDTWILLAGTGFIAVHHLVLNQILPQYLYVGGADVSRVLVHAAIVLVEATMLVIITRVIAATMQTASSAKAEAALEASVRIDLEGQLDTTTKRASDFEASLNAFRQEVARRLARLTDASERLNATANDVSDAFERTTTQTRSLVHSAANAKRRVENVAQAGRAYLDTMSAIGEQTRQSTRNGDQAAREVRANTATIDELITMSNQIDTTTRLIREIAAQTDLLALNATIEAARAGQHGLGFAVVAAEVKSLASEATKALAKISSVVGDIKGSTARSTSAMASILAAIHGLNEATAIIADAVDGRVQEAASIASDVDSAAAEVKTLASTVEEIESVAYESAKCADTLRSAANEIVKQTGGIRDQVEGFTAGLVNLDVPEMMTAA